VPAPGATGDSEEEGKSYWFVGSIWNGNDDQLPRFLEQGVWENGYDDQLLDLVRRIRPGDKIAIKASFHKKRVPFEVGGKAVSVMRIKATGTVLDNVGDGRTVKVAWDHQRNRATGTFTRTEPPLLKPTRRSKTVAD